MNFHIHIPRVSLFVFSMNPRVFMILWNFRGRTPIFIRWVNDAK